MTTPGQDGSAKEDPALPRTSLGKRKANADTAEHESLADKRRRDFERSLAGPSVGKAGLQRDQTGKTLRSTID
jgi:hypothetical protein